MLDNENEVRKRKIWSHNNFKYKIREWYGLQKMYGLGRIFVWC